MSETFAQSPRRPERSPWCANCHKRPGTKRWVGEGGALALSHGFFEMWCERCVVEAQIEYAEKQAERLPALRAKFAAMVADGATRDSGAVPDPDPEPRAVGRGQ